MLDVLEASEEQLKRQDKLRRQGYDLEKLGRRVAEVFGVAPDDIFRTTKRPPLVAARSVFCYWAVRELRVTTAAIARRLGLTQPAISTGVRRGEELARTQGLRLLDRQNLIILWTSPIPRLGIPMKRVFGI